MQAGSKQNRKEIDMDILNKLREELQVERWQVEAAVKLIERGQYDSLYFQIPERKQPVL